MNTQDLIAVCGMVEFFASLGGEYDRPRGGMPGLRAMAHALETVDIEHGDLWRAHKGVWVLHFGAYGWTKVLTTGCLEGALEDAAGCLPPGMFTEPDYVDARAELGPDASDDDVYEHATQDLTYTDSGYLRSWEWSCSEATLDDLAEMAVSKC